MNNVRKSIVVRIMKREIREQKERQLAFAEVGDLRGVGFSEGAIVALTQAIELIEK